MQEIPPDLLRTLPTLAESWRVRPALRGRWGRGDRGDWPGAPAPPRHHLLGICVAGSRRCMREKSTADRKNSKCKGPGACAGTCLASFAGSKETSVGGAGGS